MSNAYIFYGKAGSGKGTQALELQKKLENEGKKVLYIETGGLFRQFIAAKTSFAAKRTSEVIDNGQLMPSFFPVYLWAHELIEKFDGTEEIIMDGVGRKLEEAIILNSALEFFKVGKTFIFDIAIADETSIERLSIRVGDRVDDASVSKIQKRLDWYKTTVTEVINYFKQHPTFNFFEIDGERTVAEIHDDIVSKIQ